MKKDTLTGIASIVAIILFIWMACGIEGCRKHSYERVVGHPISWWDFFVISQK